MLSSAKIKYISSLKRKKFRDSENRFVVEGEKNVLEFLKSEYVVDELFYTPQFRDKFSSILDRFDLICSLTNATTLERMGSLKSNNSVLAVIKKRNSKLPTFNRSKFYLVVDGLNDPGNLGTIIRLADWFNISDVLLSEGSVDYYNPKVVNAAKGSLSRIQVHYANLVETLSKYGGEIYGADSSGINIHELKGVSGGIIVMGSESHGISEELKPVVTSFVAIPGHGGAESLNVAVATGIICDNFVNGVT